MAKAERTTRATSNGAAGSLIDALGAAWRSSRGRARPTSFSFRMDQFLELSFKGPSEFSLKVSGAPGVGRSRLTTRWRTMRTSALRRMTTRRISLPPWQQPWSTRSSSSRPWTLRLHLASKRFGLKRVIEAVEAIGETWNALHPDAPIGSATSASRAAEPCPARIAQERHRRRTAAHAQGQETGTGDVPDSAYSRVLTQELVKVVRANALLGIDRIFFNRPERHRRRTATATTITCTCASRCLEGRRVSGQPLQRASACSAGCSPDHPPRPDRPASRCRPDCRTRPRRSCAGCGA